MRKSCIIATDKRCYQVNIFSYFSTKTYIGGYSLEAPPGRQSANYMYSRFYGELRRILVLFGWKKKQQKKTNCLIWSYGYMYILNRPASVA